MISVCIATYNGEKYIREQLDSILFQLSDSDEVIISDNGSTDSTIDIVKSYNDARIKLSHFERNLYKDVPHYCVTMNFENAIKKSSGEYIFLSDQDDIWLPNKVEYILKYLRDYDLVISDFEYVDSELNPLGKRKYGENFKFHNYLLLGGKYYGCVMAFNRKILNYVLPFPNKLLLHDYWIGILSEINGSVKYLNIPLVKYRTHASNTSICHKRNSLFYMFNYRFYIILNVIKRTLKFRLGKY